MSSVRLLSLSIFVLLAAHLSGFSQTCNCPAAGTCSPCLGGITSFTLQFDGSSTSLVVVSDGASTVFSQTLNPGDQFTFSGSGPGGKFNANIASITVSGVFNVTIVANCALVFDPTTNYGSFKMIAAVSKSGGTLCCTANAADVTPPVITGCPANQQSTLTGTSCTAAVTWTEPLATDCALASLTPNFVSGTQFPIGVTTVTYTAADVNNNVSTCSFTVTVNDIPPIISNCPADIVVTGDASCSGLATWVAPIAADCSLQSFTPNFNPGTKFPIGITTVTYTAKDNNNNVSTCSFKVTVIDPAPVITNCPADIVVAGDTSCSGLATWTAPTATDCSIQSFTSNFTSGTHFPIGVTTITYTATDTDNNVRSCSFTVTVIDPAPVITNCPADIVVTANTGCTALATWTAPTPTDCSLQSFISNFNPGTQFPIGVTTVTYTATDTDNNVRTCSFTVTVIDPPPVVTNCPSDIQVIVDATCSASATWVAPTFADNCGAVTVTASHSPGPFPIGTTVVTYAGKDSGGSTTNCSFNVVVSDNTAPVISGCPANIQLMITNSSGETPVQWTPPTATDNCAVNLTSSHQPGDLFDIGATEVTYTAADNSGNTATCSFTVKIIFEELPITIPGIITPDGDGTNDTWFVANIEKYETNNVVIADRWGGIVYTVSGYNNSTHVWDGRNTSGGLVPTGTYFFILTIKTPLSVVEKKGFMELVR